MLFLHLSDIHFRSQEINRRDDPNAGLRDDLVEDVRSMRKSLGRPADAILISGDIAFGGDEVEYDFAYNWLDKTLCPAAGCKVEDVFVIPGNHDVNRVRASTQLLKDVRQGLRSYPVHEAEQSLRNHLSDASAAQLILAPIENYNRFAAKFLCSLGAYDKSKPDVTPFATRDWDMEDGSVLRVWGFNSVLVSDRHDAPNRMFVDPAAAQIERGDGITHVVMCHHPYSWLKNGADFRDRIEAVAKLLLFGHEHTRRVEEGKRFTTIRAGAVQPERDAPGWDPGYNWINLSIGRDGGKRHLDVEIWVRKKEGARFIGVPDPDRSERWTARHELPDWSPATASHKPDPGRPVTMEAPDEPRAERQPVTSRSVASKLFRLSEHVQRQVIVTLSLDQDGDQNLKDYEFVLAAVQRAKERDKLSDLNDKADEALGSASPE